MCPRQGARLGAGSSDKRDRCRHPLWCVGTVPLPGTRRPQGTEPSGAGGQHAVPSSQGGPAVTHHP